MKTRGISSVKDILIPIAALAVFLTAWDVTIRIFPISEMILPGPMQVFSALKNQFMHLVWHGMITLYEAVLGFIMGCVAAIVLAVVFQFSKTFEKAVYPYAIAIKAIPLVALAPLVVVWCGSGLLSKVVLAAVISFFPILVSVAQGLGAVDAEALDLMETLSASKWQVLLKVRFPTAFPSLFAGMKISSTFAVIGAVVAEFVGSESGIGNIVKTSSYYLDTDISFAAIIVMATVSLLFFGAICLIERKVVFWVGSRDTIEELPGPATDEPHDTDV